MNVMSATNLLKSLSIIFSLKKKREHKLNIGTCTNSLTETVF